MSAEPGHRLEDLSVQALKDLLQQQEIPFADFVEKADLIARLGEKSGPPAAGADDEAAAEAAADAEPEAPSTPCKTSTAFECPGSPKQGPAETPKKTAPKEQARDAWKYWKSGGAGSWGKKKWDASSKQEGDGVDWPPLVKLLSSRLHGTVKKYDSEKAFCFVACDKTKAIFHRDIYISNKEFGEVVPVVGDKVSFFLQMDRQIRPRGVQVKMETEADGKKTLDPEAVYLGSIKSFEEDTGFGFITCPELHKIFERDVFLHHSQLAGFSIGDQVNFRINVDPVKGTPKAKDLTVPGTGSRSAPVTPSEEAPQGAAREDAQQGNAAQEAALAGLPPPPSRPVPVPLDEEEESHEEVLAAWGGLKLPPTEAGCGDAEREEEEGDTTASPGSGQATKGSRASDSPEASLVEEVEAAEAQEPKSPAPCKRVSGTPGAGPGPWKRYALEEGVQAYWWWCEGDGDWFVEGSPEPWIKYEDPTTKEIYWFMDEKKWFWA